MSDQEHDQELELTPEGRPKIKVTDRRLFDADGNYRGEEAAAQPAANVADQHVAEPVPSDRESRATPPVERAATTAPGSPGASSSSSSAPQPRPGTGRPAPAPTDDEAADFTDEALMRFIEEQYIGGLLALGAMPEPQSGQVVEDLDLAKVRIEVLGLMQERFADHLPADARKAIDDVLYQLRMAYLQKRKVAKL